MTDEPTPDEDDLEPEIPVFDETEAPEFEQRPKYMIVGDLFIANTEAGELRFRMAFKTKLIRQMPPDMRTALDELTYLFTSQPKLIEQMDELDIEESREIARKFFKAYGEHQQARLGESGRSSRS